MSLIKKHKIKVFSEDHSSGFVVDLRSKTNDNSNSKKIIKNIIKNSDDKIADFNNKKSINNNFLLNNFNKLNKKEDKKIKFNTSLKFNKNKFSKTLFYPFWLFFWKVFKSVLFFFIDWLLDIYKFFKPRSLKVRLPKIRIFKFKIKIPKINFNFKKKEKKISPLTFDYTKPKQLKLFKSKKSKKNKVKSLLLFFVLLLFLSLVFKIFNYYNLYKKDNFKDDLFNHSIAGFESFVSASQAVSVFDFYKAYEGFSEAEQSFANIEGELQKVDELLIFLSSFSGDKKIKLFSQSKNITRFAKHLSSFGNNLSLSFNSLLLFFSEDEGADNFSDFSFYIKKSHLDLKKINIYLNKINESSIPPEYTDQFELLKSIFNSFEKDFSNLVESLDAWRDFLGVDLDKRYLFVFQNNAEIRASGGFIGSYALLDIKNAKISKIEVPAGGSYDTEGGMKTIVEPPKPLHLVRNNWYFWDANWWPDWKMSAHNLMWFHEKSGGPSVDGVIAFTPEVLHDLLVILGPVDLTEKYGVVISSDNFHDILQGVVETIGNPDLYQDKKIIFEDGFRLEDFEQNRPKEIIGDLFDVILSRLMNDFSLDNLLKLSDILLNNLNNKNILLYFENKKLQQFVEDYSWAGRIKDVDCDYLMIVDSNIAGAKSDRFLNKNYKLYSELKTDGRIINKLIIERNREDEEYNIFSGQRNVNWLRVYVPLGSKLLSATGFSIPNEKFFKGRADTFEKNEILEMHENVAEIDLSSGLRTYQESNKTVFANWTMTDLGKKSIIEIEYELPFYFYKNENDFSKHCLLWQKQAGATNTNIFYNFENNNNLNIFWTYPESSNSNIYNYKDSLNFDKYFSFLLN